VLCVPDARCDIRFANNPLVIGKPGIRFYAGAALLDQEGHALGSLCVIDTRPRVLDHAMLGQLQDLAIGVMAALRLHGISVQLADEAQRDALTGLNNRRAFDAALQMLGGRAAMLFVLDLDNFKSVNDAFGHTGADAALREVARRLRGVGRRTDRVFRLGGDAFAVLAENLRDASAAVAHAAAMHAALVEPFMIDGQAVPLGTSIGIAGVPFHATQAAQLFAAADAALFAAKRAGRGTTRLAQPASAPRRRAGDAGMGRMVMKDALRDVLLTPRFEQFVLHFQPVIDVTHGRVAAHEALVRWVLPDGRHVGPSDFVPMAEESGLVSHLDRWVLLQACTVAKQWPAPWRLSVNISPVTIGLLDVVELVRDALDRTGLEPGRLAIEVTETAPVTTPERMVYTIEGLRRLGVLPVVDDFGAGHASFAFLRRYPFKLIKTDRSFVAGLGTDERAAPVMEAMVRLARSLDVTLVAEGVETEAQFAILHRLGVPRIQGFFLGRPVPADAVVAATGRADHKLARLLRHCGAGSHDPRHCDVEDFGASQPGSQRQADHGAALLA
jgi:diguanylate cyclase (GGDEF)-like protein